MTRRLHLPQRSCVVCRTPRDKRELLRVVRPPSGEVMSDPTGKAAGRGAYVCPAVECLTRARRGNRLSRALGQTVPEAVWQWLEERVAPKPEG